MKHFILTQDKSCQFIPEIKAPALIKKLLLLSKDKDAFLMLPEHLMLPVETTEQTVWGDILIYPVFMVSKEIINVISTYGDLNYSKEVILLDQKNRESKAYCISRFIQENGSIRYGTDQKMFIFTLGSNDKINRWSNIFQIIIKTKVYTIINLDLAESLLRRNLKGIGLEEVIIDGL